jgi:hypothetical protein
MSNGHGSSRRQAYGRRMKDLRARRSTSLEIDLEGPDGWNRGDAWEDPSHVPPSTLKIDPAGPSLRPR